MFITGYRSILRFEYLYWERVEIIILYDIEYAKSEIVEIERKNYHKYSVNCNMELIGTLPLE